MNVGQRIQALRKSKGMTLKDLSAKINMSVSFLSDIENSRSSPSLKRCREIAAGLNVTVGELLGERGSAENESLNGAESVWLSLSSPEGRRLSELLCDFDNWNVSDKQELLAYLSVKQTARNQKERRK